VLTPKSISSTEDEMVCRVDTRMKASRAIMRSGSGPQAFLFCGDRQTTRRRVFTEKITHG
jgi:hypothetical protein